MQLHFYRTRTVRVRYFSDNVRTVGVGYAGRGRTVAPWTQQRPRLRIASRGKNDVITSISRKRRISNNVQLFVFGSIN